MAVFGINLKTTTRNNGKYSFPSIPHGIYDLHAHKTGYSCKNINFISDKNKPHELIIKRETNTTTNLKGRVISPDREPVSGATVQIGNYTTTTDENGEYELTADAGTHHLRILHDDFPDFEEIVDIDEDNEDYNPSLKPYWSLKGVVCDEEGNFLYGAKIYKGSEYVMTNLNGEYVFEGITDGSHYFTIFKEAYVPIVVFLDVVNDNDYNFILERIIF